MNGHLHVRPGLCIRCGACAVLAPAIFGLDVKGPAWVKRQPATPGEERRAQAALVNCPTRALAQDSQAE